MNSLPNDVILMIVESLDIDSFLEFRQTCRTHHDLISSHMTSLAPAVARSTFPNQTTILATDISSDDDPLRYSLGWLKWLRYEQLAAILVERREPHSIAAEDPLGDHVRSVVAKGWHAIGRLGDIARQLSDFIDRGHLEESMGSEPAGNSQLSSASPQQHESQRKALITCSQWLKSMQKWTLTELQEYGYIMESLPFSCFAFTGDGHYGRPRGVEHDCAAWVLEQVIRLGPQSF